MFILYANKTNLTVRKREAMTSGSVNVYQVQFEFSEDWEGLTKTAVFETRGRSRAVLLDDTGLCTIPREVLAVPKTTLRVGVYGAWGDMVLPTVWAHLGAILEGAAPAGGLCPSAPELWEQALAGKGDGLALDGQTLKLLSGEETLSQVELPASGGGPGSEEPPAGSAQNVYSEEETVIGTYFGKPLYRKVYVTTTPKGDFTSGKTLFTYPEEFEVKDYRAVFDRSTIDAKIINHMYSLISASYALTTWIYYEDHSIGATIGDAIKLQLENRPLIITLEYTKTTDTAEAPPQV